MTVVSSVSTIAAVTVEICSFKSDDSHVGTWALNEVQKYSYSSKQWHSGRLVKAKNSGHFFFLEKMLYYICDCFFRHRATLCDLNHIYVLYIHLILYCEIVWNIKWNTYSMWSKDYGHCRIHYVNTKYWQVWIPHTLQLNTVMIQQVDENTYVIDWKYEQLVIMQAWLLAKAAVCSSQNPRKM